MTRCLLLGALAVALLGALGCEADESSSSTTESTRTLSTEERHAEDVTAVRKSAAVLTRRARAILRGKRVKEPDSLLSFEFTACELNLFDDPDDLESAADAKLLLKEACRRLPMAERNLVLGQVERHLLAKSRVQAQLVIRYANAARRLVTE